MRWLRDHKSTIFAATILVLLGTFIYQSEAQGWLKALSLGAMFILVYHVLSWWLPPKD